jgi:hypothetical protein|tara:strand:- start:214 stop:372 length:159 start_codon:yes stop_codon:yes gene_type:complete
MIHTSMEGAGEARDRQHMGEHSYGQLAQLSTADSGAFTDESQWCTVENMHTQ